MTGTLVGGGWGGGCVLPVGSLQPDKSLTEENGRRNGT